MSPSEQVAAIEPAIKASVAENTNLKTANEALSAENATLKTANDSLTAENADLKESALSPEALAALGRMVELAASVVPPAGA